MNQTNSMRASPAPWALVTGASDGIGRAVAERLAAEGYNLVICARRTQKLDELANRLTTLEDCRIRCLSVDLSQPDGAAFIDEQTRDLTISCIVLAAGFGTSGSFLENELETELRMIDVNCRAVVDLSHRFAHRMRSNGAPGTIVLFSSLVGFQGVPRAANYAATKGFIQVFAEGLTHELAPYSIKVLSVAPGPVNSGFADVAGMTMGQASSVTDVAEAVASKLGTSGTIRPGFLSKLLEFSLSPLPRRGRTAVLKQVMAGMTHGRA